MEVEKTNNKKEINLFAIVREQTYIIWDNRSLCKLQRQPKRVIILGNLYWLIQKYYLGWFNGVYASAWHVKAYTSWSNSCFTVGAGWSSNYFSAGYAATYYWLASSVFSGIQRLYNSVVNKARTLRR